MTPDVDLDQVVRRCGVRLEGNEREPVLAVAADILGVPRSNAPERGSVTTEDPRFAPAGTGDPFGAVLRWCDVPPLRDGPLSGLRISVKDSVAVGGVPMTCGMPQLAGHVADTDSDAVRRLRVAGASIVAVTNMDALGMAGSGETSGYGVTRNPHDLTRTAGGSSAGAAAGLFSPAIDLALGTDQGGSVRVPASWCGVLGLKPTHGLVPYAGNAGIHPVLDHVGPLGRDVAEVAAMFDALSAGRLGAADQVARASERLDGIRVGVLTERGGAEPAPVGATLDRLEALGATPKVVSVPEHLRAGRVSGQINSVGIAAMLQPSQRGGPAGRSLATALRALAADQPSVFSPQIKASWIAGAVLREALPAMNARLALKRRVLTAAYDRALREVDVLLLPTTPGAAFEVPADGSAAGLLERGWGMLVDTEPFNLSGHPALSLPTALVEIPHGSLPVGVMLVGRQRADAALLTIAATYQRRVGWAVPAPRHRRASHTGDRVS